VCLDGGFHGGDSRTSPGAGPVSVAWIAQLSCAIDWDGESERHSDFDFRIFGEDRDTDVSGKRFLDDFKRCFDEVEQPLIVTFGGRRTLLPAVRYAFLAADIPFPRLNQARDRWSGYFAPHAADWHFDLAEHLCFGGIQRGYGLSRMARDCGATTEIAGFLSGNDPNSSILRSVAVYLLYARVKYGAGMMTRDARRSAESALETLFETDNEDDKHTVEFLKTISSNAFFGSS